jgi:arginyl-tRNA synthetase
MGLAKRLRQKPRDVAGAIVSHLDLADVCESVQIAGPGFINLRLSTAFLADQLRALSADPRVGVARASRSLSIVIDYSCPNVAKEMHVGHLRSTIIGDALARILSFQGHRVTRQNHLGDWGTQFGMLIEYMLQCGAANSSDDWTVSDLNELYQTAKREFDRDEQFADRARRRVVDLQSHDPETIALWRVLVEESYRHFAEIYQRLGVLLQPDDVRGESFYNDRLPGLVEDLSRAGLLKRSEEADVVFLPGHVKRGGEPLPLIVRKSDGGFLYASTDLAAIRYRVEELAADRIIYVTDARQAQHFAMVFDTARLAGWASADMRLDHARFGAILGPDRKPFKTREGGVIRLVDVLDEAERRAFDIVSQKSASLSEEDRTGIARAVGIGALKYADLSNDLIKDYVFDWDRMLSFEGNTAPYLQNAHVRIRSIFRKAGVEPGAVPPGSVAAEAPAERALALRLLQFPGTIALVGDSLQPHHLCTYLFELASEFHRFFEQCPVLRAPEPDLRESRLRLCGLVAGTLATGLRLLGIEPIGKM